MAEMEVEESLVTRRPKRSTAGNRMQAALAEMSIDDLTQDAEEDVDFVIKVDEEDAFESDFASTEEEEGADEEAGDRALEEEERMARRAARQKVWKTPKLPRRVAFESPAQADQVMATLSSVKPKQKPSRRVSLGQIIDAETGEVMETPLAKRKSTREATRINTQEVQSRIKDAENRRVSLTKRPKEVKRRKTQADLIAAALDLEEENIKSHRDYLAIEEERRKKARVFKPVTVGPKVRWRSRIEDVTVTVYDPVPPPPPAYPPRPPWLSPYTPAAPYGSYIPPFPGQPSPGPAPPPFPYASYNLPPPASFPASTPTIPAIETAVSSSPAVSAPAATSSVPAPLKSLSSSTQGSTTATPASTSPAMAPLPRPPTSVPQPPDPVSTTLSASSAPVAPPSMPPPFPPPTPFPSRPKTPPAPSSATTFATPVASTSATPAIPAPVTTSTPAPGTLSKSAPIPPPPATPSFPYPYPGYYPYPYYTPVPASRTGQSQLPYASYTPYYPYTPSPAGQSGAARPHLQLQPPQQVARKTTEKQTKNYVEVLLNEDRPKEKPSWRETMDSLFGKHVDWDNVRVYVGKNRPSSRQIQTCPITGLSARYRDPRSGVPYANLGAFHILSRLLVHEYVWSPTGAPGGVFVGHEKQRGAIGVPDAWADAMAGIPPKRPEPPPPKPEEKTKKEMKAKETPRPQKEIRVGERRSSRIAAETAGPATTSTAQPPPAPSGEQLTDIDNSLQEIDTMNVD